MKKLIAMLLALVMVLSLVACGAKEEAGAQDPAATTDAAATGTESADAAEGTEDAAEGGRPTLTVGLLRHANTTDYDDNDFTRLVEETANVDIEFVYFSSDVAEANTQLALMVAGEDELPDVLWGFSGLDRAAVAEYGADGYFLDLTEYITDPESNCAAAMSLMSPGDANKALAYVTAPDGAMYSYPYYMTRNGDAPLCFSFINQAWLDKLELDTPTTVEELYDVLVAFKTQDPNGNGIADEVPVVGYSGYRGDIVQFIINAFVYCNDDYFFNATDGEIWAPYNTDEYRQALIYLNKLVSEGLLNTQTFTVPATGGEPEMVPFFTPADGVAITGLIGSHSTLVPEVDNPAMLDYEAFAPLAAATDLGGYAPLYDATYTGGNFITSACEDVEAAVRFFDAFYIPDVLISQRYGTKGVLWVEDTSGVSSLGYPSTIKVIDGSPWSNPSNETWHTIYCGINTPEIMSVLGKERDPAVWNEYRGILYSAVLSAYETMPVPAEVVTDLYYGEEEFEVVTDCAQILKEYVQEARALFATGAMDPNSDADWQAYLDALEGQGLSDYIDAAQTTYDSMFG